MSTRLIRIGTRGSRLALAQARWVQARVAGDSDLVVIQTSGDRLQRVSLSAQGGQGFFTKEIEAALLEGRIDVAVHSLKDLPVVPPEGLTLAAVPEREDPADVLLVRREALDESRPFPVRERAVVGTSSTRRAAFVEAWRPDLEVRPIRGNVPTRIRKVVEGGYDCLILAKAGLVRLGIDPSPLVAFELAPERWPPAAGQAALGLEIREGDRWVADRLAPLDDPVAAACVALERRLLEMSGGGCHSAFAAWARPETPDGEVLRLFLGVLGDSGRMVLGRFGPALPDDLEAEAARWLERPVASTDDGGEAWLTRPARWWS